MVRLTVSEELVPSQLLLPLPQHHVMICRACRYAIPPSAIARHLKDIHHLNRARREGFVDFVSGFDLKTPADVNDPGESLFPVPELPVLDGLKCRSPGCGHLCLSEKRMRKHWHLVHPRQGRSRGDWEHAPLQTFFRGNQLRYFTGPVRSSDDSLHNRHEDILKGNVIRLFHIESDGQWKEIALRVPEVPNTMQCQDRTGSAERQRLNKTDKVLLDHYQMHTCLTIATDEETEAVWRTAVVRLAHRYGFLMHSILALAALHLAHDESNTSKYREYAYLASEHQDKAMPMFREAASNVDDSNCPAILTFTQLLILYSFAADQREEQLFLPFEETSDAVPSWLHFLRSGCGMLCTVWGLMEIGPSKTRVLAWNEETDLPRSVALLASDVLSKFLAAVPLPGSSEDWTRSEREEFRNAGSTLALVFAYSHLYSQPCTPWDILRAWPLRLSNQFMTMMGSSHVGALILLAHYAILLKDIENQWYFEGRATRLIQSIADKLDPGWHAHIETPLSAIRKPASQYRRLLPAPI